MIRRLHHYGATFCGAGESGKLIPRLFHAVNIMEIRLFMTQRKLILSEMMSAYHIISVESNRQQQGCTIRAINKVSL